MERTEEPTETGPDAAAPLSPEALRAAVTIRPGQTQVWRPVPGGSRPVTVVVIIGVIRVEFHNGPQVQVVDRVRPGHPAKSVAAVSKVVVRSEAPVTSSYYLNAEWVRFSPSAAAESEI